MATGTLFDVQDNILLEDCTLEEAVEWLRTFDGRGWRGGNAIWFSYDRSTVIHDADDDFQIVKQNRGLLDTSIDRSPHFPE